MFYVYLLLSLKNNSLYIGFTKDLRKRFIEHNQGKSQATRPFKPYILIFYEAFLNEKDAKHREEYLKSGYGRRSVYKMISNFLNEKKLFKDMEFDILSEPGEVA